MNNSVFIFNKYSISIDELIDFYKDVFTYDFDNNFIGYFHIFTLYGKSLSEPIPCNMSVDQTIESINLLLEALGNLDEYTNHLLICTTRHKDIYLTWKELNFIGKCSIICVCFMGSICCYYQDFQLFCSKFK